MRFSQKADMPASRDLKEQFRMLFEAAPNGAMALDAAGCIIQLNAQIEKMFGYSREELLGRPVEVLVPVRFRQGHVGLRKKFAAIPQMRLLGTNRDLFGTRKDGSEFAIEVGLNFMATSMGNVVVAAIVDINERKRAADEENIRERVQERLQVYEQLGIPAAVMQQTGQVVLTNPLFKDFHSQFVFKDDRIEVSDPTANEFFRQELASIDRKNRKRIVYSHPVLAADGHTRLIFHLLPMEGSFGSTLGLLIVTTLGAIGASLFDLDLVQRLFDLAPAEARVATLIGAGLSPRRAAEKLGVSVKNVRTTLQHVFTKVGVSRQSELAVLLAKLTLPNALRK
jgi:PAS domain S-box-containing protein